MYAVLISLYSFFFFLAKYFKFEIFTLSQSKTCWDILYTHMPQDDDKKTQNALQIKFKLLDLL